MIRFFVHHIKHNVLFTPVLMCIDAVLLLVDFFATLGKVQTNPNKVCFVKLDKIGDYLLVRNFIEHWSSELAKNGMSLTVIANQDVRFLAEFLDSDKVEWFWIDIYRFSFNLSYRFRTNRQIFRSGFNFAVDSTYARNLVLDDYIVRATRAPLRVGQSAHLVNMRSWERWIGDRFFNCLIKTSNDIIFEFTRNRIFFEHLLSTDLSKIALSAQAPTCSTLPPNPYVIFAPGAGDAFRQWDSTHFAALADWIAETYEVTVVLCGSPSESAAGHAIVLESKVSHRISNMVGKLNASDLLAFYGNALFIVCNDSGSTHLAAALSKPTICVSNGNHFGRYTEYPSDVCDQIRHVYPPEITDSNRHKMKYARMYEYSSELNIQRISTDVVIHAILDHCGQLLNTYTVRDGARQ